MESCTECEIFEINYTHTLWITEITQIQKAKWCLNQFQLKDLQFSTRLLGLNGGVSDFKAVMVVVGRSNPTGANLLLN